MEEGEARPPVAGTVPGEPPAGVAGAGALPLAAPCGGRALTARLRRRWDGRVKPLGRAALALGLVAAGCAPPPAEWTRVTAVAVADLDGDGLPDLVVAKVLENGLRGPHPGYVAVALQDAAHPGTFLPSRETPTPGTEPEFLVVADLGGDGHLDVATGDSGSGSISILLQDPQRPGTLGSQGTIALGEAPAGLAAADLDGDGRIDLVAGASDGVWVVLHGAAAGASFLPPRKLASPAGLGPRSAVATADLDGDGRTDIVAVDLGTYDPATGIAAGGSVSAFLQDPAAPGTFRAPITSPVTSGLQPVAVAVGDLDGDGRPDLAVACAGAPLDGTTAVLAVLLADPLVPGAFQAPRDHRVGILADGVVLHDLDGDGRLDAAVSNYGVSMLIRDEVLGLVPAERSSVSVLLQDPLTPGGFLPARDYPRWGEHVGIAVGDLDGDGRPDLAVADEGLPVMFQNPARPGTFLTAVPVESGSSLPY